MIMTSHFSDLYSDKRGIYKLIYNCKYYLVLFDRIEEPTHQDVLLVNRVEATNYIKNSPFSWGDYE